MTDLTKKQTSSTSILMWTNSPWPNTFVLKQGGKKFLGLVRTDRRGEVYWKFKELKKTPSNPVMDKVTKFQHRQEKTKEYDESKFELSNNS